MNNDYVTVTSEHWYITIPCPCGKEFKQVPVETATHECEWCHRKVSIKCSGSRFRVTTMAYVDTDTVTLVGYNPPLEQMMNTLVLTHVHVILSSLFHVQKRMEDLR